MTEADQVKALSEKPEIINLQFAGRKAMRRLVLHWLLIAVCGCSGRRRREQPLPGLGLQRPEDRRHGGSHPRL